MGADSIISIHISSHLSGTYRAALLAKEMLPEADIEVIDSEMASAALGVVVLEAARAAQSGASKAETMEIVKDLLTRVSVFFMVDTLKYLEKGGRIGKAQAFLGTMLNIKPILTLEEGVIVPAAKARGRTKGMDQLLNRLEGKVGSGSLQLLTVFDAVNPEGKEVLTKKVRERWDVKELLSFEVGPVIGTHVGPGTLAIVGIRPRG